MTLTGVGLGRIVHYVLSGNDAVAINRRRRKSAHNDDKIPGGVQIHVGNSVVEGQHVPATIVHVWNAESGMVNLKCELDGSDVYWATSIGYSETPAERTWHWPEPV